MLTSDDTGLNAGWARVDNSLKPVPIRVDGGAARNDTIVQSLADAFGSEFQKYFLTILLDCLVLISILLLDL